MAGSDRADATFAERRASERFDVPGKTWIDVSADGRRYRCEVENVSLGGLNLRLPPGAPDTNELILSHPVAGEIVGHVAWRNCERVGIQFEAPARPLEHALRCVCLLLYSEKDEERDSRRESLRLTS